MLHYDRQWQALLANLLRTPSRATRAGLAHSLFNQHIEWDLADGFPLLTTKRVPFMTVVRELLWFLSGDTNVKTLQAKGVKIWDADWRRWGQDDLGPIYGKQWRNFGGVDQILSVMASLTMDPYGRRHIVTAWSPAELDQMALPPCHYAFQFYVDHDNGLNIVVTMRSCDVFLGLPFNLASYALLLTLMASYTHRRPRKVVINIADAHLYEAHTEQANIALARSPHSPPVLVLPSGLNPLHVSADHFVGSLVGYTSHDAIPALILAG